jgi:hypothetical protein
MKLKIENLLEISKGISIAELTDLASKLSHEAEKKALVRVPSLPVTRMN